MGRTLSVAKSGDREIVMTRQFDAPRALVFDAWTRPELVRRWFGPHGTDVAVIVVEHRDRLARFGVEYIEAALSAQGRTVRVVDPGEVEDDLVRDMTDVLTSFCARQYGKRAARNRAKKALAAACEDAG